MDHMLAIRDTFFQECDELLATLETGLATMEEGDTSSETVNAVFRAVHSIKGGAGAFKLHDLVTFAHAFETTLDRVRSGTLIPNHDVLKLMLRAVDALSDIVSASRMGVVRWRNDHYVDAQPGPRDVLLLIEVAISSLRSDRERKLPLYAAARIPEVWLVDLDGARVVVYRAPRGRRYTQTTVIERGGTLTPIAFPDLTLTLEDVLGPAA